MTYNNHINYIEKVIVRQGTDQYIGNSSKLSLSLVLHIIVWVQVNRTQEHQVHFLSSVQA